MPVRTADTSWKLLPGTSTALEKDVLRAVPFDQILKPGFNLIAGAKGAWAYRYGLGTENGEPLGTSASEELEYTPLNDSWLPWVAIELGVNRYGEFITDGRLLISQGLYLNRVNGTPRAVLFAMALIGYPTAQVWEQDFPSIHFPEYHIDLGKVPAAPYECCKIWRFNQLVKPVRSRLRRLYHGLDRRQLRLSDPRQKLGMGFLSGCSGWKLDPAYLCDSGPTDMIVSFRRHHVSEVSLADELGVEGETYSINFHEAIVGTKRFPVLSHDFEQGGANGFYEVSFAVGEFLPNLLMTENGEFLVTENGDFLTA